MMQAIGVSNDAYDYNYHNDGDDYAVRTVINETYQIPIETQRRV